jgi:hypothetical protein
MNKQQLSRFMSEMFNARWVQEQGEFRFKYCDLCLCLEPDFKTNNATFEVRLSGVTLALRDVDNEYTRHGVSRVPVKNIAFLGNTADNPLTLHALQTWLMTQLITLSLA